MLPNTKFSDLIARTSASRKSKSSRRTPKSSTLSSSNRFQELLKTPPASKPAPRSVETRRSERSGISGYTPPALSPVYTPSGSSATSISSRFSGSGRSGIGVPPRQATTANPTSNGIQELIRNISEQVRIPTQQLTLEDVFSQGQQDLARQGISQRVARVLDPELQRGMSNIGESFAGRNLFRSGIRSGEQGRFGEDIAEKRAIQERELFNIRRGEAQEDLRRRQEQLEKEASQARGGNFKFSDYIR